MKRKMLTCFVATVLMSVLLPALDYGAPAAEKPAKLTKVIIGEGMQPPAAPIYVAKFKGYWKEEGLDVQLQPFASGRLVLDAVLGRRVDAGYMAETPPMLAAFTNQPVRLLTAFESSNKNTKVMVRKDLGITKPSDLIGKKVAVSVGTNGEYFMSAFLKANGIKREDLKVINLSPADMVTAITRGGVEAIFTWEPHLNNAKTILGDKGELWYGGEIYREGFYMGTTKGFIAKQPEVIKAILRGLIKAEKFILENPDKTIAITAPRVNMEPELLKSIWHYFEFRVALDQFHLDILEGEGKWAMKTGIAPEGSTLPDFRRLLYPNPLREIDPSRVTVKR